MLACMTDAAQHVRNTGGALSCREWVSLWPPTLRSQGLYALGRARLVMRVTPRVPRGPLPSGLTLPMTDWTKAAFKRCRTQTPEFQAHCYRTWYFATLLSELDNVKPRLDAELIFVAAALHDYGLRCPTHERCFTIAGADMVHETARDAGVDDESRASLAADAVIEHASVTPSTALARYLQAGSLLDVIGQRMWDMHNSRLIAAYSRWPRVGFAAEVRTRWLDECRAVPSGRAAYARFPGLLLLASRFAPLPR